MQGGWYWFIDNGHKLLAMLLTVLTFVNAIAPDQLTSFGRTWALWLLAAGTWLHVLYLAPQPPVRPPT